MMLTALQLHSVHHNLSCDKRARGAQERKDNTKRVWSTNRRQGNTRVI